MNVLEKANILSKAGKYDSCGPEMCEVNVNQGLCGIYHAKAEHETCRIFKTLMDNNCSFDCKYCSNSNSCTKKKAKYEPKELVTLFNYLHTKLDVNGLFISSAVSGAPDKITDKMIDVVKTLRVKHRFKGYIHFKVLPGTSYDKVKEAAEYSSRMSINIESPTKSVLSELSSCKDYKNDLLKRQTWIAKLKGNQATQMIINEMSTDKDVIKRTDWGYSNLKLKRVYYSAFRPVKGTPLENAKAESLSRQNRLYNVDFLMRCYKFKVKEFNAIMDEGMLPKQDPKMALAMQNLDSHVDINEASYEELIRIPGIGPRTAVKIIHKKEKITRYEQLHKLGGWVKRAKPFIEVGGKRQKMLCEF
ncbi:helix-hairpin-helix domain-containing protein [Candidatus Woesearchaeota archaeon]|nr:helix-hairpin-helix domain-containing protein [Candidatus Woesearchaeota archaeon]